jgi:hypothetical protein
MIPQIVRKPMQELASISLKQFDAETKNFAPPDAAENKAEDIVAASPNEPLPVVAVAAAPEKETKRLTIDLDDMMNYKFSQYALDQGKEKTEIIREWISEAIAGR